MRGVWHYHGRMKTDRVPTPVSTPLTDAEVAELDELLMSAPDDREPLDVAMLDGYLVGVLLQPESIPIAEWLPLVFDEQGRDTALSDVAAKERATRLIMRRHDELASYIAAREPFDPVIFELEDDAEQPLAGQAAIPALEPWAAGFMSALETFPALLERLDSDEAGAAALIGILRHLPTFPDDASEEAQRFAKSKADIERDVPLADLDEAITDLVEAVMEVADLTRPRRPTTRASPKVGRNELCACGSGKKFKHCHGREVH